MFHGEGQNFQKSLTKKQLLQNLINCRFQTITEETIYSSGGTRIIIDNEL